MILDFSTLKTFLTSVEDKILFTYFMDILLTSLIFKSKRVLIVCFTAVSPIGTEIFKASLGIFFGIKLRNACNNLSSPKTIAVFFLVISIVDNALPISLA